MYAPETISGLIADIYDGIAEPSRWHSAIQRFVDMSGGKLAFFAVIDSATATLPASSILGEETSRLADALNLHRELVPLDPGLPYALARPEGGVFRFSDTSRALTREPDTWRAFIRHELGSGDYHSRFSAEHNGISLVLALHTLASQPSLTREQQRLHAIVFDHLQRATRLAYRPPDLTLATHPTLLVDGQGTILDANLAGEMILSDNDGLTVAQGRLRAADHDQDKALRSRINDICNGPVSAEAACIVSRPSGSRRLLLKLGRLPLPDLGMNAAGYRCLIEIRGGTEQRALAVEQLQDLFGLTPREAEIAALFVSTFSDLRSAAAHLGISHETARVHVRSIYSKTGAANQVELVRILTRLI